jgi:hypothetical protein
MPQLDETIEAQRVLIAASDLADAVYIQLIGGPAVPCPCGNGRIPTGAYRAAVDAYAQAIRCLVNKNNPQIAHISC